MAGPGICYIDATGKLTPTGTLPVNAQVLYQDYTIVSNPNNTSVNNLHTYTMPASTMDTDGDTIRIDVHGRIQNASGIWAFNLVFGGVVIPLISGFAPTPSIDARVWGTFYIVRTGASSQILYGSYEGGIGFSGVKLLLQPQTIGETMGAPIIIRSTGQTNPANTALQSIGLQINLIKA